MKNQYINMQIKNIIPILRAFNESIRVSAIADDKKLDKEEKDILKKTEKYINYLKEIGER